MAIKCVKTLAHCMRAQNCRTLPAESLDVLLPLSLFRVNYLISLNALTNFFQSLITVVVFRLCHWFIFSDTREEPKVLGIDSPRYMPVYLILIYHILPVSCFLLGHKKCEIPLFNILTQVRVMTCLHSGQYWARLLARLLLMYKSCFHSFLFLKCGRYIYI